jgi:hypothetical protein
MSEHKFLVTGTDVGIVVEASIENAGQQIKKAREILTKLIGLQKAKNQLATTPKSEAHSLSGRILSLGSEFFTQPREALEISKELARGGYHYRPGRVRDELLRLVKRGQLRRIGEGRKSNSYRYVNP